MVTILPRQFLIGEMITVLAGVDLHKHHHSAQRKHQDFHYKFGHGNDTFHQLSPEQ